MLFYTPEAEALRATLRDVFKFPFVDAGEGWLIFTMPPAELGVHPADGEPEHTELHFMCDDVVATVAELKKKGVKCAKPVDRGYGIVTSFKVPGAGSIGLYQPKHPVAYKK